MPNQRDIIEVNFRLPDGKFKAHPALIISSNLSNEFEETYIIVMLSGVTNNDDFTFWLKNEMLNRPTKKPTQVRCHLISLISKSDIINQNVSQIKAQPFKELMAHLIAKVFDVDFGK